MKKYLVFYSNNVESNQVAEFDTIDEARAYCDEQTRGEELASGDMTDRCHLYQYVVYDLDKFNENEGVFDCDPEYATPYYWENER